MKYKVFLIVSLFCMSGIASSNDTMKFYDRVICDSTGTNVYGKAVTVYTCYKMILQSKINEYIENVLLANGWSRTISSNDTNCHITLLNKVNSDSFVALDTSLYTYNKSTHTYFLSGLFTDYTNLYYSVDSKVVKSYLITEAFDCPNNGKTIFIIRPINGGNTYRDTTTMHYRGYDTINVKNVDTTRLSPAKKEIAAGDSVKLGTIALMSSYKNISWKVNDTNCHICKIDSTRYCWISATISKSYVITESYDNDNTKSYMVNNNPLIEFIGAYNPPPAHYKSYDTVKVKAGKTTTMSFKADTLRKTALRAIIFGSSKADSLDIKPINSKLDTVHTFQTSGKVYIVQYDKYGNYAGLATDSMTIKFSSNYMSAIANHGEITITRLKTDNTSNITDNMIVTCDSINASIACTLKPITMTEVLYTNSIQQHHEKLIIKMLSINGRSLPTVMKTSSIKCIQINSNTAKIITRF